MKLNNFVIFNGEELNMSITVFANGKGGVGKSTQSTAFAWECMLSGQRVLLVDADPQASILEWAEHREIEFPKGINIMGMAQKNLHRDIKAYFDDFDHIVIDTPGRFTDITRSAIIAADVVIIPCKPSQRDAWAAMDVVDLITEAQVFKDSIKAAFLINMKTVNTKLSKAIPEILKQENINIPLLKSEVCKREIYAECGSGLAIQEVAKNSPARKEVADFYLEIMELHK